MQAEQVIATHGNTDFDAFAAMVAVRHLYPGAVICLAGSLNRNVREFYRLYADELNAVDASRLQLDAVRRLIVVETKHAARLGGARAPERGARCAHDARGGGGRGPRRRAGVEPLRRRDLESRAQGRRP